MKKLIVIIIIIASLFCLVCCDADSIVKAGEKMHDVRSVNNGYADDVLEVFLEFAMDIIDAMIEESPNGYRPNVGDMPEDSLNSLVEIIKRASESAMSREEIVKILSKVAVDIPKSKKINLHIDEVLNKFIEKQTDILEMAEQLEAILPDSEQKKEINRILKDQVSKVVTLAKNIQPAIDAVQAINDQSYEREGMTYADVIAKAILYRVTYDLVGLVGSIVPSIDNFTIKIANELVNYLTVLEIMYDVSFDVPEIAGRFIENKINR